MPNVPYLNPTPPPILSLSFLRYYDTGNDWLILATYLIRYPALTNPTGKKEKKKENKKKGR